MPISNTCHCDAYPFPHRASGGACEHAFDAPALNTGADTTFGSQAAEDEFFDYRDRVRGGEAVSIEAY